MTAKASILQITCSNELINGETIYVSSNCLPVKATRFEPAGHSFHDVALKLAGCFMEEKVEDDDEINESLPKDKEPDYMQSAGSYSSSKGKKKSGDGANQQDHYALLGLGHLRYLATEEQIRKSYRDTALKHHPDKQAALLLLEKTEAAKEAKKDEIETHFKAVQEAYEYLIDPAKRRVFDSTDEFDDEIPTDCAPQDFFKVFGPAFLRNGKWSVTQPIPLLGDENSSIQDVDAFYDFWYSFKSWREFPHEDEFDLDEAESRDEKRWMERQNAKLSEKSRKEEYTRIRSLVDNAYKRDPRVLKRKEMLKAEKQKKKESKYMAKKLQEEEAARIAEEERIKKEEEEKQAAEAAALQKKNREKEKKLLRKERTRLRTLSTNVVSQHLLNLNEDDVESLCMSLDMLALQTLCDNMETKEESEQAKLLGEALGNSDRSHRDFSSTNGQRNGSVKVNGNAPKSTPKKNKSWGKEEVELLRKGVAKFPKGTSRRWEVISEYIGTGRSVEEILKATKTVLLQKPDSSKAFDTFLDKRKPAESISSPLSTREEVEGVSSSSTPVEGVSPKPSQTKNKNMANGVANGVASGVANGVADGVANGVADGVNADSDSDEWSTVQVTSLVQAMKTFPKEANQRWERIAAAVPGKTVNQCKKQFTLLKDKFRNKKN